MSTKTICRPASATDLPCRASCYRYRAIPSGPNQAYADLALEGGGGLACLHRIPIDETTQALRPTAEVDAEIARGLVS